MAKTTDKRTKQRLIAAASTLFAERGFHGTKARDIAGRAAVNLAASNYHYGSKKDLYVEVLRAQFADIRDLLQRRGATRPEEELSGLSHAELEEILEARVAAMLELLLGPPPGLHGTLMLREMADPSEALPLIVAEFIVPMTDEFKQIVARLAPDLSAAEVERCVFSIIGQALFYRASMPAMLFMLRRKSYPRGFAQEVAAHICQFSLGGMEHLAARNRRERVRA